jgi:peptidyl-prolyl cis-trans isomerase A (cyclophilin A)
MDDPAKKSNTRGHVTFAKTGAPNSRSTQIFINFKDNSFLDRQGFSPFGVVMGDGMKVVDSLYAGYGDGPPGGRGPSQGLIQSQGNAYLTEKFPELDYVKRATIVE